MALNQIFLSQERKLYNSIGYSCCQIESYEEKLLRQIQME